MQKTKLAIKHQASNETFKKKKLTRNQGNLVSAKLLKKIMSFFN